MWVLERQWRVCKILGPRSVRRDRVTLPIKAVLVNKKTFQTHWSTRVRAVGADAHLGTEAVAETVGKPGRRVVEDPRRVDAGEESASGGRVFGDNRVGVVAAMRVDVVDSSIQALNDAECDSKLKELSIPVICTRTYDTRAVGRGGVVAAVWPEHRVGAVVST